MNELFDEVDKITSKKCSYCKEILSVENFHVDKTMSNGYKSRCKSCIKKTTGIAKPITILSGQKKLCSKCRKELGLEFFVKNNQSPDGHAYYCKECTKLNRDKENLNKGEVMNELNIFKFEDKPVRTVTVNEEVYFVAKDVAEILGYSNPQEAVRTHCKGVSKSLIPSTGGNQEMSVIPERDVYRLIMRSNLPAAEKFENWVVSEVLPSIRKNGGYLAPQVDFSDPSVMLNLLENWKEDRDKLIAANKIIENQRPKVLFADAVESSVESILIRDLAKIIKQNGIDIGEKRLFQWMRDNLYIQKTENKPTQKSMDLGVMELIEGLRLGSNQQFKPTFTTKVTGKGQIYFVKKLLESGSDNEKADN